MAPAISLVRDRDARATRKYHMREKLPPYMLGLIDGFEICLRIHRKHLDSAPKDWAAVRRALQDFRKDVQVMVDIMQTHRLGETAAFFGFDSVWTPERAARLRALAPLEVEIDDKSTDNNGVSR